MEVVWLCFITERETVVEGERKACNQMWTFHDTISSFAAQSHRHDILLEFPAVRDLLYSKTCSHYYSTGRLCLDSPPQVGFEASSCHRAQRADREMAAQKNRTRLMQAGVVQVHHGLVAIAQQHDAHKSFVL